MVNTYPDIAIRPDIGAYPLVHQKTSAVDNSAAADAAAFRRILNMSASRAASASAAAHSAAPTASSATAPAIAQTSGHLTFAGFMKDLFDIINPLQHIPIVSAIYRHITGDKISPEAQFIGDSLYGGPIGGAVSAANIAYQEETGKTIDQAVIADLTGQHAAQPDAQVMDAQNLKEISPATLGGQAVADNIIWNKPSAVADSGGNSDIVWNKTSPAPTGARIASLQPVFSRSIAAPSVASQPAYSLSPPSTIPGTIEEGSASPSIAPPALHPKGAASTIVLQTQEAPVGKARKAMPPELIAQKMMMGLEKYAAMKHRSLAPTLSANY